MISLRITDGTTTVDLNDGDPWEIMELDLGYGDPSEREISGSIRFMINGDYPNDQKIVGNISTNVQILQKLLQQAINYWANDKGAAIKDAMGDIVYLEYRSSASSDYYRSPLVQIRYAMPDESLWALSIGTAEIEYVIDFMRRNWWEGPETQISIGTSVEDYTTDFVTVYNPKPCLNDALTDPPSFSVTLNETGGQYFIDDSANELARFVDASNVNIRNSVNNDGDYLIIASSAAQLEVFQPLVDETPSNSLYLMGSEECEFVKIQAAAVSGDLPASTRVLFKNTSTDDLTDLWIGHWFSNTDATIILEAEDGNYDYVDDLISDEIPPPSEGYLLEYTETFPGGTSNELIPVSWTLDTSMLAVFKARYFKAILKLYDNSGAPNNYNYQMRIRRNTTIIWEGPIVRYGGYPKGTTTGDTVPLARDLGTFRIPPQFKIISSMQALTLELVLMPYSTSVTAVSGIKIDYLMLLPVDGFRYLQSIGGVDTNSVIYDDGYQGLSYVITGSGKGEGDVIGYGNQIMLQPGVAQRLYFFQGTDVFRTGQVQLYYRPRRLSL